MLDESDLQAVLKRGKLWTSRARQCIQTIQACRATSCQQLAELLMDASTIKLKLSPEVGSDASAATAPWDVVNFMHLS